MLTHSVTDRSGWRWLGGVLVAALCLAALRADEPKAPPPLTPEQRGRLKERARLWAEGQKLRGEGKLAEAIAALGKVLAIEQEVFGNVHHEVAGSLQILAQWQEAREDFAAARQALQERLDIQTKLYGPDNWQVTDARLDLDDLKLRQQLQPEDRARLREADRLN